MKYFLSLAVAVVLLQSSVYSQITVSDAPKEEVVGEYNLLGTKYYKISKLNGICTFIYRDEKFTKIDTYKSFLFRETDLDALYALFTDFASVKVGDEKSVVLEDGGKLIFKYKKTMGKMYAEVYHVDKAGVLGELRFLTPAQFKKLFGK